MSDKSDEDVPESGDTAGRGSTRRQGQRNADEHRAREEERERLLKVELDYEDIKKELMALKARLNEESSDDAQAAVSQTPSGSEGEAGASTEMSQLIRGMHSAFDGLRTALTSPAAQSGPPRGRLEGGQSNQGSSVTCFRCGKPRHPARLCRAPADAIVASTSRGRPTGRPPAPQQRTGGQRHILNVNATPV
jgi:hypothetical protein